MIALQTLAAGVLVLGSAGYAAWRLMTPRSRLALARAVAAIAPRLGGRWLAHLQAQASPAAASGCQSCSAGAAKRHLIR
jgi:hypothetical protein